MDEVARVEASFQIPMRVEGIEDMNEKHKMIFGMLAMTFGGCYAYPVVGSWKYEIVGQPDMVITEPMLVVVAAIRLDQEADFREFAMAACRDLKQDALYWVDRAGVAHVEPTTTQGRMN